MSAAAVWNARASCVIWVNYRDDKRRGLDVGLTPATLP